MPGRVLVTVPVPEPGPTLLAAAGEVDVLPAQPDAPRLRALLASGRYAVVLSQLTDDLSADQLADASIRGIANYAVGHDNVDVAAATRRGIVVTNTPGVLTDATADVAMLLMLAVRRRALEGDRLVRGGGFTGWSPTFQLGHDVSGATLGLVGRGRIATAVARRAAAFGMTVQYCSVRPEARPAPDDLAGLGTWVDFEELLATSDVVSLHVPLTEETRHLVDGAALATMRRTATLINTARGPVVDEVALAAALADGTIAGAGLDVYEREPAVHPDLLGLPQVVLLPHIGSATHSVRARMAEVAATNAVAILRGQPPPDAVNPEAWA